MMESEIARDFVKGAQISTLMRHYDMSRDKIEDALRKCLRSFDVYAKEKALEGAEVEL